MRYMTFLNMDIFFLPWHFSSWKCREEFSTLVALSQSPENERNHTFITIIRQKTFCQKHNTEESLIFQTFKGNKHWSKTFGVKY